MKPRILIIDEPSSYLYFIKNVMLSDGYEVMVTETESEIQKQLKEYFTNLILIDVHMNNSQGFEILEKLRKAFDYSAPIIITSRGTNINEIEKAFNLGAYDYLIKPLNLRDLKNKIKQAIAKQGIKKDDCHV